VALPLGAPDDDPTAGLVREVAVVDLPSKHRQSALRAGAGEELAGLRWLSPRELQATLRKVGAVKGKSVVGRVKEPPPPAQADAAAAASAPAAAKGEP
jgi:hypothetical protein